jgi:hypothetical protein
MDWSFVDMHTSMQIFLRYPPLYFIHVFVHIGQGQHATFLLIMTNPPVLGISKTPSASQSAFVIGYLCFKNDISSGCKNSPSFLCTLKGLSYEIDFENVDENCQILALIRAAAGS